ncbi:MAG: sensor histidine kinase [Betaproteobacteria bacterium]
MSSWTAPAPATLGSTATPTGKALARSRAREALLAVLNLRVLAGTFFVVLLTVVAQAPWHFMYSAGDAVDSLFKLVRFLRQSLISAYLVLLAVALVQALAAARDWSPGRTLVVALPVMGVAALASMVLRIWAVDGSFRAIEVPYWIAVLGLWMLIGSMACVAFSQWRAEAAERRELAELARARDRLEAQRCEAQLAALDAQIEPHFLFNTLANVKRLYETAPTRGREMMGSLIEYLRAALPVMRSGGSTLGRELELVGAFLAVLKMRMGDRLDYRITSQAELGAVHVPPLVLPTLVENAVKHGLAPLPDGGHIEIGARREGDKLLIWVEDSGAGFTGSGGSGVGLANTRARLAALYGPAASLSLAAVQPHGVRAEVRLPLGAAA